MLFMQRLVLTIGALVFGVCAAPHAAMAETRFGDFSLSGNAAPITDYVYSGVAQSDEGPAIQGGFDISHTSGLYAGIWASNVDFNDGCSARVVASVSRGF